MRSTPLSRFALPRFSLLLFLPLLLVVSSLFSPRAFAENDKAQETNTEADSHALSTPAVETLPVDLEAIKKIRVAGEDLGETPLRVGNLDILAPIVAQLPSLGATATRAADANIPDLKSISEKDRPAKNQFFQLNFPQETQNPPLVFAVGRSVAYIEKEAYPLRAAPLVIKGKLWLPIFSIAPLLAASPRLEASGTLNLNPTIQSVEVFEVRGVLTVTVKASAPIADNKVLMGTLDEPDNKVYFDFPGFSMGFDAGNTTGQRTVSGGQEEVQRVRAGLFQGFPDTTRVTLDLTQKVKVDVQPLPDKSIFAFLVYPTGKTPKIPIGDDDDSNNPPRSGNLRGIRIVIDPGHGDQDFGAVGRYSNEKTGNLDIGKRLYRKLQNMGATVSMTRYDDTFVTLQGRVAFAQRQNANIFFSVHINSYQSTSSGTETYYYTPQSRALAVEVHKELIKATGLPNRGVRSARFYVIRKTTMPAILTETAFISNPREEQLLMNPNFRERVASAMAQGIVNYAQKYLR